jgi:hypothetical protein
MWDIRMDAILQHPFSSFNHPYNSTLHLKAFYYERV